MEIQTHTEIGISTTFYPVVLPVFTEYANTVVQTGTYRVL